MIYNLLKDYRLYVFLYVVIFVELHWIQYGSIWSHLFEYMRVKWTYHVVCKCFFNQWHCTITGPWFSPEMYFFSHLNNFENVLEEKRSHLDIRILKVFFCFILVSSTFNWCLTSKCLEYKATTQQLGVKWNWWPRQRLIKHLCVCVCVFVAICFVADVIPAGLSRACQSMLRTS